MCHCAAQQHCCRLKRQNLTDEWLATTRMRPGHKMSNWANFGLSACSGQWWSAAWHTVGGHLQSLCPIHTLLQHTETSALVLINVKLPVLQQSSCLTSSSSLFTHLMWSSSGAAMWPRSAHLSAILVVGIAGAGAEGSEAGGVWGEGSMSCPMVPSSSPGAPGCMSSARQAGRR